MLQNFNRALDDLRAGGTEAELAAKLGISHDVLTRYRRGELPKNVRKLTTYPELLQALAADGQAIEAEDAETIQSH